MADSKMQLVDCKIATPIPIPRILFATRSPYCLLTKYMLGLDDLCVRFIINLPREELELVERICFQVEEAQWFYEDFIRPLDPSLPSLSLRAFSLRIFQHCPLLSQWSHYHHSTAFSEFLAYKTRVPVRGAIMLNEAMDQVVLVKGWKKGANWSFPRGKINKDEKDLDCAIREVYEETGYDIREAGLVGEEKDMTPIDVTMREQHMRLYVFRGVPMDTNFEPRTRKEISKIEWYKLSDLPTQKKNKHREGEGESLAVNANKFYMVAPFLSPLKKWIAERRKEDVLKGSHAAHLAPTAVVEDVFTEDEPEHIEEDSTPVQDPLSIQTPSDLPEVSVSRPTQHEASAHLKRLLNVNNSAPPQNIRLEEQILRTSNASKSNALLDLLRKESNATISQISDLPQTPMEQISFPPNVPRSPHGPHPHPSPFSTLPPPPHFPIAPIATNEHPPRVSHPFQRNDYGPAHRPPHPDLGSPQHPHLMPHHPPTIIQRPPMMGFTAHGPSVPTNFQSPFNTAPQLKPDHISEASANTSQRQVPAPYQRTGDPQFAQAPQFPPLHAPSIPPASKLPPPKLTSHSLALLNVFKNGSHTSANAKATHASLVDQPDHFTGTSPANSVLDSFLPSSERRVSQDSRPEQSMPHPQISDIVESDDSKTAAPSRANPRRSQHQDKLLNLLRQSSFPPGDAKPSFLTPAATSAPVELAAQPSPSLLKEDSEPAMVQNQSLPGATSVERQRRPRTARSKVVHDGHTSATVSGPLNMPQFEGLARSRSRHRATNGTNTIAEHQPLAARMTILPRRNATERSQQPSAPRESERAIQDPPKGTVREAAKPFQRQILRRPAQPEHRGSADAPIVAPSQEPTSTAATKAALKPENPVFDRRSSQTEAHKQALLSLFNKPPPQAAPSSAAAIANAISPPSISGSPHSNLISPLTAGESVSQRKESKAGPISPSRSRLGSLSSMVGSGSQTPSTTKATTPSDKAFLLSYLNSVAKGDRR